MKSIEKSPISERDRFTEKDLRYVMDRISEARKNPGPRRVVEDLYGEVVYPVKFQGGK